MIYAIYANDEDEPVSDVSKLDSFEKLRPYSLDWMTQY